MSGVARIAGYASLFGRRDGAGDTVLRGAFSLTLRQRGTSGIRMLWQHDPARPIGTWDRIVEDSRGLRVIGTLAIGVPLAREAAELIRVSALDGLSIGFKARRALRSGRGVGRTLLELDLWEISLVTFPQLDGARVRLLPGRADRSGFRRMHGGK